MRFEVLMLAAAMCLGWVAQASAQARLTKPDEIQAAQEVSSDAEKWAASQVEAVAPEPVVAAEPASEVPAVPAVAEMPGMKEPAAPTETAKPAAPPPAPSLPAGVRYNEMKGSISSIDVDQRILRLALEGGYNVQFSYDPRTILLNGGNPIPDTELRFGDKVQIRYAGKELKALEIERYEKAPRLLQ